MNKLFYMLAASLLLSSCLSPKIKDIGASTNKSSLTSGSTTTSNLSGFNIAYASKITSGSSYVAVQGAAGSGGAFINTCTSSGTNCYCDFYDSSSNLLGSSGGVNTNILYSSKANLITCKVPGAVVVGNIASVRIRNGSGTIATARTSVLSTLGSGGITLTNLLGGLDTNYVRRVYSYDCYLYARQKNGTTPSGFDCSDQGGAGDFKMLRTRYSYYVYADNYTSITGLRATDYVFNNGIFCSVQAPQVDCTSISSGLTQQFGLYGVRGGAFTSEIQAFTAPPLGLPGYRPGFFTTLGYGIPKTEFLNSVCPYGFTEKNLYVVNASLPSSMASTFIDTSACNGGCTSDNELLDLNSYVIANTGLTAQIPVQRSTGGNCVDNTTGCTLPSGAYADFISASWKNTSAATSAFCVIDNSLL